jgi:sugar lactone lactonase YvrE
MCGVLADAQRDGNVYFTDDHGELYVYSKTAKPTTSVSIMPGSSALDLQGLARRPTDNLIYVLMNFNPRSTPQLYSVNTTWGLAVKHIKSLPETDVSAGIAFNNSGTAYITGNDGRIYTWSGSGETSWVQWNTGISPASAGLDVTTVKFDYPYGIAVDAAGNVLLSENGDPSGGHRVWLVKHSGTESGKLQLVVGAGSQGKTIVSGDASRTELSCPWGVAFGPEGASVYIAENCGNPILKVSLECTKQA